MEHRLKSVAIMTLQLRTLFWVSTKMSNKNTPKYVVVLYLIKALFLLAMFQLFGAVSLDI